MVASEGEFVGFGIKKRPSGGADRIGAIAFTEKLDDMIGWGDNDAADNDNGKLIAEKGKKARENIVMDQLTVVVDVVQEIVTIIDLMDQIKGYSLAP